MVGRLEWETSNSGWYKMDNFDLNPTWYEMYNESYFFIVTTCSGAGFGNVVPSTSAEYFVGTLINYIGSTLFICIFFDFMQELIMRDLPVFDNSNLYDETLCFAENSKLPESLVFKIRYYYKDLNL